MPDLHKMDRTWLCSVVFMDIVNYSSQSVDQQMKWKQRFNGYLGDAIRDVPEAERVILDTGDGAAICFLGAPEAAMFAGLQLCEAFVLDEREHRPGLCVRVGINLGPVKLIRDINGALNAIGDGINAGQRIMSFAATNQILVSQSFFEVVSRLSDDYKTMFQWKGVEADKHVREHTVYRLLPPGSDRLDSAGSKRKAASERVDPDSGGARPKLRGAGRGRSIWLAVGGGALAASVGFAAWFFLPVSAGRTPSIQSPAPVAQAPTFQEPVLPHEVTPPSAPAKKPLSPKRAEPESTAAIPAAPDPAKLTQKGKTQFANHDMKAARASFQEAADAGDLQAIVLMGTFFAQGLGGPQSDPDAVRMFRLAADRGDARGMYNLGLMYEAGRAGPADQAPEWYAEAARRGDADAAYRLGLMYEQGRGVPKDLGEARRLYALARTPQASARLANLPQQ